MTQAWLFLLFVNIPLISSAQSGDFPFGGITYKELEMKKYEIDTSAIAVVLNEYGFASINENVSEDNRLFFEYHAKIKILKKEGLSKANFEYPLLKIGNDETIWLSLEATTYNRENGTIKESKFDPKNFFIEKGVTKNYNVVKFALPNVSVGSVIEIKYKTESPFFYNFHRWEFQDDVPKIHSEYWCRIPANWVYNIALRGFLRLNKNESGVVKDCFEVSSTNYKADCLLAKYAMNNIPSFVEEQFMTTKKNFLSAINFELSEIQRFDGRKIKYAEEWKDVDNKLRTHEDFGRQIKKAKSLMEDLLKPVIGTETDPLTKAKLIYAFVKKTFSWNENNGCYTELGVKKALDEKKGNVADINLSLVGALQSAGLDADPLLISTRDFGLPVKIHPQRTGFNYVAARLKIGGEEFLLDATDDFLPFGVLPVRCLNDQGRVVSKTESGWINLTSNQKNKTVVSMDMKWLPTEELKGSLIVQYSGYDALDQRKKIKGKSDSENLKELGKQFHDGEVENYKIENAEDLTIPLTEKIDLKFAAFENTGASTFYFNPFLLNRYEKNPFHSTERLYPVDLGAPIESNYLITIELPENILVDEAPKSSAFSLPNGGGRCFFNIAVTGKTVTAAFMMSLSRAIYTSEEYHYLKEFFSRVVQVQQSQFVFKKIK